jgi:hypothetical protein
VGIKGTPLKMYASEQQVSWTTSQAVSDTELTIEDEEDEG